MTDKKDDMPAWASTLSEKLDRAFPEEPPEWVRNLFIKLDAVAGDDDDDATADDDMPAWAKGIMDRLDKVGGTTNSKTPNAPKRRTTKTPPQTDKPAPKTSRWFGNV